VGSVGFEAEMPSDNPADPFRRDALARRGMEDDEPVGDLLQAQWGPAFRGPKLPDDGQNLNWSLALAGLNRAMHKKGPRQPGASRIEERHDGRTAPAN